MNCADCQYLCDKYSFPMPNNKEDVFKDNPWMKHYYCCCGDSRFYGEDITSKKAFTCECFEEL